MASSEDMLRKLEMWKNSKTSLRLTLAPTGKFPEQFVGVIIVVDWESGTALFVETKTRGSFNLNVVGAKNFLVGVRSCGASRAEDDFFALEEIDKGMLGP